MLELIVDSGVDMLPMKVIGDIQVNVPDVGKLISGIDADFNVYVFFDNIDRKNTENSLITDLTGRGETYKDACKDLIFKLQDKRYRLCTKNGLYRTRRIRSIINYSCFNNYYVRDSSINERGDNIDTQTEH